MWYLMGGTSKELRDAKSYHHLYCILGGFNSGHVSYISLIDLLFQYVNPIPLLIIKDCHLYSLLIMWYGFVRIVVLFVKF